MIGSSNRASALRRTSHGIAAAIVLLGPLFPAFGEQPLQTLLVGLDHRPVISLNGDWHYLVDQSPSRALYAEHGAINDKSYAMNEHPNIIGKHNEEYDFSTAPTLKVPGDWNTQVPSSSTTRASSGISETSTHSPNLAPVRSSTSVQQTTARTFGSTRNGSAIMKAASRRSIAKSPLCSTPAPTLSSSPSMPPAW